MLRLWMLKWVLSGLNKYYFRLVDNEIELNYPEVDGLLIYCLAFYGEDKMCSTVISAWQYNFHTTRSVSRKFARKYFREEFRPEEPLASSQDKHEPQIFNTSRVV